MDKLQQARVEIDAIDAQMAELFERRMLAVAQVAQHKAATGMPVFDPEREAALIEKNTARLQSEALRPYYRAFLGEALEVSKAYQRSLLGADSAAYQGVEGAWSQIALRQIFPFAKAKAYATWAQVCDAVEAGECSFGVFPFENSNAGDVSTVLDLLYAHPCLAVTRMYDLPIRQDLLGVPGSSLATVKTVISHQQALAQSSPFIKQHGLAAKVWGNTADAARHVAESGDVTLAAIASEQTARLYGLEVLAAGINEDGDNTTRFVAVEKTNPAARTPAGGDRIALLFTVDHKPGKLAGVIELIGRMGFNMECIKSRPLPHVQFEYYFYVQLICPEGGCGDLMAALESICRTVRLLGVFAPARLTRSGG